MSAPPRARDKIASLTETTRRVNQARRRGDRIVLTNGCFDLLHTGHVRSLEQARSLGDRLVVGVNLDGSVRRLKGPGRPIVPARPRMELVAALACVDYVLVFDDDTPHRLLRALRPDVLVKGGTYSPEQVVGREVVRIRRLVSWRCRKPHVHGPGG